MSIHFSITKALTTLVLLLIISLGAGFIFVHEKEKAAEKEICFTEVQKTVRGYSMEPLFHEGETIRALLGYYGCHPIARGDIILADYPGHRDNLILKSVKGIPGDSMTLTLENEVWNIQVNGSTLVNAAGLRYALSREDAEHLRSYERAYQGLIPDRYYLVLGEIADGSLDSIRSGLFFEEMIVGKVLPGE